ncbi:hypothetical protein [Symbioplanes lichenis]|uniref:hypothetical protein n=1 Tax=Symbioplanes lichenis TaxID=1629072 RepID=UPI0027392A23|nr:hypothetical protein [Actinoplanes lichenis]
MTETPDTEEQAPAEPEAVPQPEQPVPEPPPGTGGSAPASPRVETGGSASEKDSDAGVPESADEQDRAAQAKVSADYVRGKRPTGKTAGLGESESLDEAAELRRLVDRDFHRFAPSLSSNSGIFTAGDDSVAVQQQVTVVVNDARQISVLRSTYSGEAVRQFTETYLPAPGFDYMLTTLTDNFVVVVQGVEGSGRRATAVNLLHELGLLPISVLDVDQAVPLRDIVERKLFEKRGGYILDHWQPLENNTLDALGQLAREARSLIVVVANGEAAACPLTAGVRHPAPAARDVLGKHLTFQLRDHNCTSCTGPLDVPAYVTRRLDEIDRIQPYALPGKMREVVDLARVLAENLHTDVATAVLVERDRASLRKIASDAMRLGPGGTGGTERWQSFRLAYAVFDGFPLRQVFEAAELLAREVLPIFETRESPPDHVVFEGAVSELLLDSMYIADPIEQLATAEVVPRRARLVDPALTRMILDVVWNDFDSVHLPLLTWLDVLAEHPSAYVRVRAAQAAALLAGFDFDQVYRALIRPWAERGLAYRQSAAAALQLAAAEARLAGRVHRQVSDWVRSPNPNLQDSAARALSTTIGATDPIGAVDKLRDLAGRPDLAVSNAVGLAMVSLFATEAATLVLDELTAWASGRNVHRRRHAVRAVLLLSRTAGGKGATDFSSVRDFVGADDLRLSTLAALWRDALIGPDTAGLAWEPLRRWLISADEDRSLDSFVIDLASRVLLGVDRSRALFHLRLWRSRHPQSPTVARLFELVQKG